MKRSRDVRVLINIQEDRKEKDEPDSIKHLNDDTTRLRQVKIILINLFKLLLLLGCKFFQDSSSSTETSYEANGWFY